MTFNPSMIRKVQYRMRPYTTFGRHARYEGRPRIILEGRLIEQAGFPIGKLYHVEVSENKITLTALKAVGTGP